MIGLFDSGSGGLNTVRYLKASGLDRDLIYLIDRNNAPYGVKSEKEILKITENNLKTLTGMGAERVLIACCTASTVYGLLPEETKRTAIPIIDGVARRARELTHTGRIGVIATRHTVRSHAFARALADCEVTEIEAGGLVDLIDSGLCDATATNGDERMLCELLEPILDGDIDTLVLGCTHFSSLYTVFERISRPRGISSIADSARIGADILTELIGK